MANKNHLRILKQGAETWNNWRRSKPMIVPDLFDASLNKANLAKADLLGADLRSAGLVGADLSGVNLIGADLSGANLAHASLRQSILLLVNFSRVNLDRVDFTEAVLGLTILGNIDLGVAIGLETTSHFGPSTLVTDTLYLSKGKIPEAFLRGAGVPDKMIEFSRLVTGTPELGSCFISYSTKDEEFAQQLYKDLQANGVRCWFAPQDMKGGKKLYEQIDRAIHHHDRTLLILSPNSINSHWVKTEIAKARKREVEENRQILFPIRLVNFESLREWEYFDADRGTDYAKEIREYFIPDFSNWRDHDSYQAAFARLRQDLTAEPKAK